MNFGSIAYHASLNIALDQQNFNYCLARTTYCNVYDEWILAYLTTAKNPVPVFMLP